VVHPPSLLRYGAAGPDLCLLSFLIFPSSFFLPRVRGEKGETKEVTLATAFSEK
jgi:hypothetical protein